MVKYVYDAWGNGKTLSYDGSELTSTSHIGCLNPIRYRGYYYDTETGLYYLKTRYYDPEIGRFITIDDLSYLDPEHINGLNLYAYCGNNPVMAIDPNGTFSLKKLWKKAKKAVGWVVTAAVALAGVALIVGTAIGMAAGTIMTGGLLAGVLIGAGVGILAGMGSNIVKQGGFSNIANMNPWDITKAGLIGGGIGAFSAGMSYSLGVFGESYGGVIGNMLSHIPVLSSIATKTLTSTFTVIGGYVGKILGGYIGGTVMNILGDDIMNKMEGHNADVPNWIMTLFHKFFGQIKG